MVLNDGLPEDYVLNEIQNSLTEISPSLTLKSLNLPRPAERSYLIQPDDPKPPVVPHNIESIVSNTMKFNKDQRKVFNTIAGEILHGLTADNLYAQFNVRLIINLHILEHTS